MLPRSWRKSSRLRWLRRLWQPGLASHRRFARKIRIQVRRRKDEAAILREEIWFLWAAARAFEGADTSQWEEAVEMTRQIAIVAVARKAHEEKVDRYLNTAAGFALFVLVLWLFGAGARLTHPLFHHGSATEHLIGHSAQVFGFLLLFGAMLLIRKFEVSVRYLRTMSIFADTMFYIVPLVALAPNLAICRGWMSSPPSVFMLGLYDGLFICALCFALLSVTFALLAFVRVMGEYRRGWGIRSWHSSTKRFRFCKKSCRYCRPTANRC